jgi:hypothetical protein
MFLTEVRQLTTTVLRIAWNLANLAPGYQKPVRLKIIRLHQVFYLDLQSKHVRIRVFVESPLLC